MVDLVGKTPLPGFIDPHGHVFNTGLQALAANLLAKPEGIYSRALQSITINAAHQYFEENTKGSLEPGILADLLILDKNPLKVEPMAITDIMVVEKIKERQTI